MQYLPSATVQADLSVGKAGALQEELGEDHARGNGVDADAARSACRKPAGGGRLGVGASDGQGLPELCSQAAHELPYACKTRTGFT